MPVLISVYQNYKTICKGKIQRASMARGRTIRARTCHPSERKDWISSVDVVAHASELCRSQEHFHCWLSGHTCLSEHDQFWACFLCHEIVSDGHLPVCLHGNGQTSDVGKYQHSTGFLRSDKYSYVLNFWKLENYA